MLFLRRIFLGFSLLLTGCSANPTSGAPVIKDSSLLSEEPCADDGSCAQGLTCVRITTVRRCVVPETVCPRIDCGEYLCKLVASSELAVACATLDDGGLP
jgi:hypothetical protein